MDYLDTIKRGFAHTWNNKFLWVLGFLAALGSGSSFNYSFNSGDAQTMPFLENWMTPERIAAMTTGLIAFGCIAFILGIVLWLVSLSARGGLIGAVAQLETGRGTPTFGSAFRMGWRRVLRLVGMTILLFIIPFILFLVIAAAFIIPLSAMAFGMAGGEDPTALMTGLGGISLVALCLLCLLVPFTIALSLIYAFAFRGIILRNMGVMESLRHGWGVLRGNLGEIIILGLAFLLVNIVIGIVVLALLVPLGLVVGVPLVMLGETNATALQGLLAVLGVIVGLVVVALLSAITTAWQSSTFTVAYLKWAGKDVLVE